MNNKFSLYISMINLALGIIIGIAGLVTNQISNPALIAMMCGAAYGAISYAIYYLINEHKRRVA